MTTQDNDRARIAVVGAGWWSTQAHLPSLTHYPPAQVVAIADLSQDKLRAAGDAYGIQRRYTDFRKMLDDERPDGVVVATNHASHYEVAKEVLARKIGLMLEKPMVLHAREARELQGMAEEGGVALVVGYPWHFIPQHRQLRDLIASGRLGQLQFASNLFASMVLEFLRGRPQAYASIFNYPVTGPTTATYSDPAVAGGGQGHLQVTHSAALLLWLTGLKPVSISAFMEQFDLNVDLCDAINVRFEGGAIGTLASTGGIPTAHSGNQKFEYRIFGTEGYATLEVLEGTCTVYDGDGGVEHLEPTPPDRRYPQEATSRHLVDLLLGHATINISPSDVGVRTVELLEAAYRSVDEGRVIRVDEL
jgi:predicted dehydrogenase